MAKQLNIFVENRPGRMAAVTKLLGEHGIDIRAITIQDRGDFGMMKLLVDRPTEAHGVFSARGFACALKDVLAILIEDRPGGLSAITEAFARHGVNVVDGYGFVLEPGKRAVWCVQAEPIQTLREIAAKEGFVILEDHELYEL